ncbi:chorismate mutase 2 isoform X1 [Alnus glutinosa]|uniref:chorismate mutase 2 isoform X1 n=2 Tax=Alnus glutinosa TaxID=3517 RepID=UPI002D767713|nr:chorismate mutase 2 isoform X1 [Alnus glutinosa]
MVVRLLILFLFSHGVVRNRDNSMAEALSNAGSANSLTLESVRQSLIRQEDTIVFGLIERARFPINSPTYNGSYANIPGFSGSLAQFLVRETEALQAKAGRFTNPEEHPFFPKDVPPSLVPSQNHTEDLHPSAASININKSIWDVYFDKLLALFAAPGDDGNYEATAASDLVCLQALSRRIHYGKLVAEVKFKTSPTEYEPAIRAKDRDALMKLLTVESVEEEVKKRVAKKAMVFGQEVTLNKTVDDTGKYKVDPSVLSRLYGEWVMPLTKLVEVEYLLRRLD